MHQENPHILVAGSLMVDIIAVIADSDIERVSMSNATTSFLMLEQGKKIDADGISTHVGGGAANVAVSLKRQGLNAAVFASLGNDLNGEKVLEVLRSEEIDQDQIHVAETVNTGTSVMVSSHDHNAAIFTHRGANGCLTNAHVEAIDFSTFDALYLGPLSNDSADIYCGAIEAAKAGGCFVAANPGIRQLTSRTDGFLAGAKNLDLLAINFEEVRTLLPLLPLVEQRGCTFMGDDPHTSRMKSGLAVGALTVPFAEAIRALYEIGSKIIVVTDGKRGAYLFDGNRLHYCSSLNVETKGTAGAGDAYISTLVGKLLTGEKVQEAMAYASVNAASVVGFVDTQTGLLTRDALKLEATEIRYHAWDLVCKV